MLRMMLQVVLTEVSAAALSRTPLSSAQPVSALLWCAMGIIVALLLLFLVQAARKTRQSIRRQGKA